MSFGSPGATSVCLSDVELHALRLEPQVAVLEIAGSVRPSSMMRLFGTTNSIALPS